VRLTVVLRARVTRGPFLIDVRETLLERAAVRGERRATRSPLLSPRISPGISRYISLFFAGRLLVFFLGISRSPFSSLVPAIAGRASRALCMRLASTQRQSAAG
jgi:hypothetical protein